MTQTPRTIESLIAGAAAGNRRAIARLISRVEAGREGAHEAIAALYPKTGRAHVVGLTGVPGSGKSTLVRIIAGAVRKSGRTVGVIAINPSSPFSGGSILGDRIRMTELTGDPGVFIRSMATRGALGGLAAATLDAVDVLDAAGFDLIVIETVGVGQDEVDIVKAAHTTVVVSAPGLGDDIQAIKAGILEVADIHVVSKVDRPDASKTVAELKSMLSLGLRANGSAAWVPPVLRTSAETGEGVERLVETIDAHWRHFGTTGELEERRRRMVQMRMLKAAEEMVRQRFASPPDGAVGDLVERVVRRDLDPYSAAMDLLSKIQEG